MPVSFDQQTWIDVPDESSPGPGSVATSAAELNRMEQGIADAVDHANESLTTHGGNVVYTEDSTEDPTDPPTGLIWVQPDTGARLVNDGTPSVPVWNSAATDRTALKESDIASDFVVTGLQGSVPTDSLEVPITAGAAYVDGTRIEKTGASSRVVPEGRSTFVEINSDGDYGLVPNGRMIEDCQDPWNETTDADFTQTNITGQVGDALRLTIASGASAGDKVTEVVPLVDLSSHEIVKVWVRSSIALDAGDVQLLLDNTAACASPVHTLNLPDLDASTWTEVDLAFTPTTGSNAIISVGIKMVVDKGAYVLDVDEIWAHEYPTPAVTTGYQRIFEARANRHVAQKDTVTVTSAVNSTAYTITINGVAATYTSDGSATLAEISDGLMDAINDHVDPDVSEAVVATNPTASTVLLTSLTAGVAYTISVGANLSTANNQANEIGYVKHVEDLRQLLPQVRGVTGTDILDEGDLLGEAAGFDFVGDNVEATFDEETGIATVAVSGAPESHAETHKGDGSDPIAAATPSVDGLESAADKTKLNTIETGATGDQTAAEIKTALLTVDGTGSGVDADKLDGVEGAGYAAATHSHAAADVTSGVLAIGRLATGSPDGTKFVRDDGTLAVPSGTGGAASAVSYAGGTGISATDVEGAIDELATEKLDKAGGTLTGDLTLSADPSSALHAATKQYVDAGKDAKASVRAASTANGTLATAFENGDTLDGVTLATGNRILLKNQTSGAENGIYTVNASGAPTRATDADTSAKVTAGLHTFVEEGTTNADTGWVLTTNDTITLGTTALVFAQFTGTGAGFANPMTTRGDLITGASSPAGDPQRLARGSTDQYLKTNSSGDLTWGTPPGVGQIAGAYDIEAGSYTDAGMSDEFASGSLDAQWTLGTGTVSGTISFLAQQGSNTVYDLATRSGTLLMQPRYGVFLGEMRQAYALANGESIIISLNFAANPSHSGWETGIALSSNSSVSYASAATYRGLRVIRDTSLNSTTIIAGLTHQTSGNIVTNFHVASGPAMGGRAYLRLTRVSGTLYYLISADGVAWTMVFSETDPALSYLWLRCGTNANTSGVSPIFGYNWIRHVASAAMDPW